LACLVAIVAVRIRINLPVLRRVKWHEHLVRFLLGGVISVLAALIAKRFGPEIGGLFLAFPAIFPAGAMLLDKHEREKKQKAGIPTTIRGRLAVGLDARGAAMGSIALAAFALVVWKLIPTHSPAVVCTIGVTVWIAIAVGIWRPRELHLHISRRQRRA
jgi:Protein of unknown function (DUF3147)